MRDLRLAMVIWAGTPGGAGFASIFTESIGVRRDSDVRHDIYIYIYFGGGAGCGSEPTNDGGSITPGICEAERRRRFCFETEAEAKRTDSRGCLELLVSQSPCCLHRKIPQTNQRSSQFRRRLAGELDQLGPRPEAGGPPRRPGPLLSFCF